MEEQRHHQEERIKRALERAKAEPRKRVCIEKQILLWSKDNWNDIHDYINCLCGNNILCIIKFKENDINEGNKYNIYC